MANRHQREQPAACQLIEFATEWTSRRCGTMRQEVLVRRNQSICRFEIPVDDTRVMCGSHATHNLTNQLHCICDLNRTVFQNIRQRSASDVLHHDHRCAIRSIHVMNRAYVWMVESRSCAGFIKKLLARSRITFLQDFECHISFECQVLCKKDRSKRTATDFGCDSILSDHSVGTKRLCDSPLSSVRPDAHGVGFRAAEILHDMMQGVPATSHLDLVSSQIVVSLSSQIHASEGREVAMACRFIREHASDGINVGDVADFVSISR